MTSKLTCFKAYDIRGELGPELNEEIAWRIGRAYAEHLQPKTVVVGGDVRLTSPTLKLALANGLMAGGADVIDLGLCGTEEVYFATWHLEADGGIMVTASHNPINYNGMKPVGKGACPISPETGMNDIQALAEANQFTPPARTGTLRQLDNSAAYIAYMMQYVDLSAIRPMKLVVNAGNGAACDTVDRLESAFQLAGVPVEFIKLFNAPDGTFPNGIPNPILKEQHEVTSSAVLAHGADLGIAWDGDFDRCFLFDNKGIFIEGYYIVGLLAEAFLKKNAGSSIIYDPRLIWNTEDIINQNAGVPLVSKSGHSNIKAMMRERNAVYGGEMSAHHYFRDFAYCDSGMIPWLLVIELLSRLDTSLNALVAQRMAQYPSPGEINSKVADSDATIAKVLATYQDRALSVDCLDGISLDMGEWRFNLRQSNTEPVIRLNLETRGDQQLMTEKTEELLTLIRS